MRCESKRRRAQQDEAVCAWPADPADIPSRTGVDVTLLLT